MSLRLTPQPTARAQATRSTLWRMDVEIETPLLSGGKFRVEPVVTQPAPPQTRTCAMNASGSSVTSLWARGWRIPFAALQDP